MTITARRTANPFWLVQRLAAPHSFDPSRGFDGYFSCEYMGSAEFEWGAVPESLKRLRDNRKHLTITKIPVDAGKTVYLIHDKRTPGVVTEFLDWLTAPEAYPGSGPRSKENTHLTEALNPESVAKWLLSGLRTVAWWSLRNDVMFTLDAGQAQRLLQAIHTKPSHARQ